MSGCFPCRRQKKSADEPDIAASVVRDAAPAVPPPSPRLALASPKVRLAPARVSNGAVVSPGAVPSFVLPQLYRPELRTPVLVLQTIVVHQSRQPNAEGDETTRRSFEQQGQDCVLAKRVSEQERREAKYEEHQPKREQVYKWNQSDQRDHSQGKNGRRVWRRVT